MDRRSFLQVSAGLAALSQARAAQAGAAEPGVLAGIALAHDCAAVCIALDSLAPKLRLALARRMDIASLGAVVPSGARRLFTLLDGDDSGHHALALGIVIQRAAVRQWAPATKDPEAAIYQDAALIRAFAADEHRSLERVLQVIGRRLMIGIHTFEPDAEDVENWIVRLIDWDERTRSMYSRYAAVVERPDASKMRSFVEGPHLYDPTDPVCVVAAHCRAGQRLTDARIVTAIDAPAKSVYGKALRAAVGDVRAISDYASGKTDQQGLRSALGLRA